MKTAIGVMARAPLPGLCKTRLCAAHPPEWVAGLYAAMLRDTLDGLQAVLADEYVVFVAPLPEHDALEVIGRYVPAPWELVAQSGEELGARMEHAFGTMFARGAGYALLSGSDSPSYPTEGLAEAFADEKTRGEILVGPTEDGGYALIAMPKVEPRLLHGMPWSTPAVMETTRLRCRELGLPLRELPKGYDVDEPSDVLTLLDELRKFPERAPRTAQFFVKNA